jgi:hypothetical protein
VLNASGAALNAGETGFFVDPIRVALTGNDNALYWDSTTKEMFYAPGPDLATVLDVGASANSVAITDAGNITGNAAALFELTSGVGQGILVEGLVGASLVATTGSAKVEATDGVIELNFSSTNGDLNLVPPPAEFVTASIQAGTTGPTYTGQVKQLKIQIAGIDYWIALNPAPFA